MAIGTDDQVEKTGTPVALATTSGTVAKDGAFSVVGDLAQFTNSDEAPMAKALLEFAMTLAPAAGQVIQLFAQLIAVASGVDTTVPQANHQEVYMGDFRVLDTTNDQDVAIDIRLPNWKDSSIYQFYLRNLTDEELEATWELTITPKTIGPAAYYGPSP